MSKHLKPSRYSSRATIDMDQINQVLDESLFCTVAYVKDGRPYQIPTGFVRKGSQVMIHGSVKSHFLDDLRNAKELCFSSMLFDGLVLADTAFDHSVNYRSVVMFSEAIQIADWEEKKAWMEAFTEKYVPGRIKELPGITEDELKATEVLVLNTDNASLKMRKGGSGKTSSNVWTGEVPASVSYGVPLANELMEEEIPVPDYLTRMVVKSNI